MPSLPHSRWALGLALLIALVPSRCANGQGKGDAVHFDTADGVKIEGTYWASDKGKKAPVVILLHDFHPKTGGSSQDDGWNSLAAALNKDGFAVLQFDFRGFGKSTTVDPTKFWTLPHNKYVKVAGFNPLKPPESIGHGDFANNYYPALANDVAAARAFLDRKNDGGELNTSSIVLIGAGDGAAIGALWLATDLHRKRGVFLGMGVPIPDARFIKFDATYDGKDVKCAVWLDISSRVPGSTVPTRKLIEETGKVNKVPMAFLYGKGNKDSDQVALSCMKAIAGSSYKRGESPKDYPLCGDKDIDTKLTGSKLLQKNLDTEKWIVTGYLDAHRFFMQQKPDDETPMKKHLKEEWRERDWTKSRYYWLFPGVTPALPQVVPAKNDNDMAPLLLPLGKFGIPL